MQEILTTAREYRIPNIFYYEVDSEGTVPRRIDLRTYEKTVSLYDLEKLSNYIYNKISLVAFPMDIQKFKRIVDNKNASTPGQWLIEKSEFEALWEGQLDKYADFERIKLWEQPSKL